MTASPKIMTTGHKYRHDVAKIIKDIGFDLYGGAHGSKRTVGGSFIGGLNLPWLNKIEHVKDYMFHVVIENDLNDAYYTEKITDCFAVGTIPIYWGTKELPKIFSETGIIRLESGKEFEVLKILSKNLYMSMLKGIQHNFDALQELKIADDYLYEGIQNEIFNSIK
jgi:hypothetical protein